MNRTPIGWPVFEEFVEYDPVWNAPIFEGLTRDQLLDCQEVCQEQLKWCHPESQFVPLIEKDLKRIRELLNR